MAGDALSAGRAGAGRQKGQAAGLPCNDGGGAAALESRAAAYFTFSVPFINM